MSEEKQESKQMDAVGWDTAPLHTLSRALQPRPSQWPSSFRLLPMHTIDVPPKKHTSACIHPSVLHPTPTKADGDGLASNLVVQHILQRGSCAPSQANVAVGIGDARFPSSTSHQTIFFHRILVKDLAIRLRETRGPRPFQKFCRKEAHEAHCSCCCPKENSFASRPPRPNCLLPT